MRRKRFTRKKLLKKSKEILSSLRIIASIYPLVVTAFLSSCVTYVATAKASQQITLHYVPISITPSTLDNNIGLNSLTISDQPNDVFTDVPEVNEPANSPIDKDVILHGDRNQKRVALT